MEILKSRVLGDGKTVIKTGFEKLDGMVSLRGGKFVVIAARPGMGKTAFATNIMLNAAQSGFSTLMFSIEMSVEELTDRMVARQTGMDLERIIHATGMSGYNVEKIGEEIKKISELPIYFYEKRNISPAEICGEAKRISKQKKIDMIIIDYIQLIKLPAKKSRYEAITDISRDIKILSSELDIPVLGIAQLNRAGEQRKNKRPVMADLRDSGALEQDADIIIMPHRDEGAQFEDIMVLIEKNRQGKTGKIDYTFKGHTQNIFERI